MLMPAYKRRMELLCETPRAWGLLASYLFYECSVPLALREEAAAHACRCCRFPHLLGWALAMARLRARFRHLAQRARLMDKSD